MTDDDSRHARGLATLRRIHGSVGEDVVDGVGRIAPDFSKMLVDFPFGDIYARIGLDLRSRQIATIAALVTLGSAERQLKWHVKGGLNVGLSRDEIVEVVMQMAVYAGFPRALNALAAVKEAFDEIDAGHTPSVDESVICAEEAARQDDA